MANKIKIADAKARKEVRDVLWSLYRSKGDVEFLDIAVNDRLLNDYDYFIRLGEDNVRISFEKFPKNSLASDPKHIGINQITIHTRGEKTGRTHDLLGYVVDHPYHLKVFRTLIKKATDIEMVANFGREKYS